MAENFSANDVTKLEYPYSIWKRPSFYLGGRGSQKTVGTREIIDNSTHEKIRGFASRMRVTFGADGSIEVIDNGRGLPVDVNKKTGDNGIILTVGTMNAGTNFSSNVEKGKAGAGLNGVGSSATNALSSRFDVIVYKNRKKYSLSFQNGFPGYFDGEGPDAKFTPGKDIIVDKDTRLAEEKKLYKTGTYIKFWFNPERFPKDEKVDIDDIVDRLKYIAYIVPDFNIEIIDETRRHDDGEPYLWDFYSKDGLEELIEVISTDEMLPGSETPKGNEYQKKGIYKIPVEATYKEITADEHGVSKEIERTVTADVAFRYGTQYDKKLMSFANTIHTHMGGIHEQALEQALLKGFGERLNSMRGIITAKDEPPIVDDYFEGMTAVISINVPEPQFIGQQKDKLSGPEVKKALQKALIKAFGDFAQDPKNQAIIRPMFEKIVQASRNRQAALVAKMAKRKANQVSSGAMPAKLADCDITGEEESELLICEGDSAKGTIVKARDATYQAVIPIRGKIMNGLTAKLSDVMKNKEILDIGKALGAGFGDDFDIDKIRYSKVLLSSDADIDGLNISNLLYTVFNRMFKPMLEEGRVYQTVPPLFEVTVGSGKRAKTHYVENEYELNKLLARLNKAETSYKIARNKGLGEMTPQSFSDTVLNPETRILRRITVEDAEKAEAALILTMGPSTQERKDFMEDNFQVAIDTGLVEGFEGEA